MLFAHRAHKGPKALWLADPALGANRRQGAQEGLLLYIFDIFRTGQAATQSALQEPAEIGDKMGLDRGVLGLQSRT